MAKLPVVNFHFLMKDGKVVPPGTVILSMEEEEARQMIAQKAVREATKTDIAEAKAKEAAAKAAPAPAPATPQTPAASNTLTPPAAPAGAQTPAPGAPEGDKTGGEQTGDDKTGDSAPVFHTDEELAAMTRDELLELARDHYKHEGPLGGNTAQVLASVSAIVAKAKEAAAAGPQ